MSLSHADDLCAQAAALDRPVEDLARLHVMEGLLRRWTRSAHAEALVVRGGLLTCQWLPEQRRVPHDVDFMAPAPVPLDALSGWMREVFAVAVDDGVTFSPAAMQTERIWAEAMTPGARLRIPARIEALGWGMSLQIDVSMGDPIRPAPRMVPYRAVLPELGPREVFGVVPTTSLGWKVFGLFERDDDRWRPKDLCGIYQLMRRFEHDEAEVREAVGGMFAWRSEPITTLSRLLEEGFGTSKRSRSRWRQFRREHPWPDVPDELPEAVQAVAAYLRPICAPLFAERLGVTLDDAAPGWQDRLPPFPTIEDARDVEAAIAGRDDLYRVAHPELGLRVYTYRSPSRHTFPDPAQALHPELARLYQLRRECRGLTFDAEGALVARKLHKFFGVEERGVDIQKMCWDAPALILEKLDGSMIVPLRAGDQVVWTTRLGPSEVAEQARAFAAARDAEGADHAGLIAQTLDEGWTPCFEWCSRQHPIVLDHPVERLALTAIRHRRTGRYLDDATMREVAARHGVEVVRAVGTLRREDTQAWIDAARAEVTGEGYVLRFVDGHMLKIKNDRYARLHTLVTRPEREAPIWRAILTGEIEVAISRAYPGHRERLQTFWEAFEAAITRRVAWLEELVGGAREVLHMVEGDPVARRKRLATGLCATLLPCERVVVFLVWDGADAEAVIRAELLKNSTSAGRIERARPLLYGLRWSG